MYAWLVKESPETHDRWVILGGKDPSPEEVQTKIHELELRSQQQDVMNVLSFNWLTVTKEKRKRLQAKLATLEEKKNKLIEQQQAAKLESPEVLFQVESIFVQFD